jgi:hypothetical protein
MPYGTLNADTITNSNGLSGNAIGPGFKNRIINGDMRIDQRNAGAAVTINSTASTYTVDRFLGRGESADGVFTIQQDSSAPAGFTNSLKATVTTADASIGASQLYILGQILEGFNVADLGFGTANAKTVTLSFWVRSSLTGTFGGVLKNDATYSYPFTYTISSADTWEYKTVTITGQTAGTWATNNSAGMRLFWSLGVGSTFTTTANAWASGNFFKPTGATDVIGTLNATWYVTGVQLEVGPSATSFDYRPFGTELALCQRYYEVFGGAQLSIFVDTWTSGNVPVCVLQHKVTKRASPTVTSYGTFTLGNTSGSPIIYAGVNSFSVYINVVSTSARAFWYNNSDSGFTASAEF